jgi:hypothetical protein
MQLLAVSPSFQITGFDKILIKFSLVENKVEGWVQWLTLIIPVT